MSCQWGLGSSQGPKHEPEFETSKHRNMFHHPSTSAKLPGAVISKYSYQYRLRLLPGDEKALRGPQPHCFPQPKPLGLSSWPPGRGWAIHFCRNRISARSSAPASGCFLLPWGQDESWPFGPKLLQGFPAKEKLSDLRFYKG